jgi:hypothetical protein
MMNSLLSEGTDQNGAQELRRSWKSFQRIGCQNDNGMPRFVRANLNAEREVPVLPHDVVAAARDAIVAEVRKVLDVFTVRFRDGHASKSHVSVLDGECHHVHVNNLVVRERERSSDQELLPQRETKGRHRRDQLGNEGSLID